MPSSLQHDSCPLCDSVRIEPLKGYEKHHLFKCKESSFVFAKMIPSQEDLESHYSNYNRSHSISDITLGRYREILKGFEKYRSTNRIFDIGCGMGDFLGVAMEMGWEVSGCEYTPEAVQACSGKGIEVFQGAPDSSWLESGSFDVVCSFEVIEHLSFPTDQIRFAHHLLRKNGLFYCTTPNFNSIERYTLKSDYNVIDYPEHLSYFTKRTLDAALVSHGFKRLDLQTTGISPARIKKSLYSKRGHKSGSAVSDENLRSKMESSSWRRLLKELVNSILNVFGIGNALKASYFKS